jgi:hypothetical protein
MSVDKGITGIPTISASRLKAFKTCAKQYYYRYITHWNDRPEEIKNVAALLGTALHAAIEQRYSANENPTLVFQTAMSDTLTEWEDKGYKIIALDYFPRALTVGKNILRNFDWDRFTPIALEHKFTLPFPNTEYPIVNITGVIDLLDFSEFVVDHKSDKSAPNQDELDNNAQFIIYYWAYQQLYDKAPKAIYWNHLRTGKLIEANIAHNYHDKLLQLESDIDAMVHTQYFARINMSETCRKRCSYFDQCYGLKVELAELEEIEVEE